LSLINFYYTAQILRKACDKLALAGAYHRGAVYSNLEDFWNNPGNKKVIN